MFNQRPQPVCTAPINGHASPVTAIRCPVHGALRATPGSAATAGPPSYAKSIGVDIEARRLKPRDAVVAAVKVIEHGASGMNLDWILKTLSARDVKDTVARVSDPAALRRVFEVTEVDAASTQGYISETQPANMAVRTNDVQVALASSEHTPSDVLEGLSRVQYGGEVHVALLRNPNISDSTRARLQQSSFVRVREEILRNEWTSEDEIERRVRTIKTPSEVFALLDGPHANARRVHALLERFAAESAYYEDAKVILHEWRSLYFEETFDIAEDNHGATEMIANTNWYELAGDDPMVRVALTVHTNP